MDVILQEVGGGGESDMAADELEVEDGLLLLVFFLRSRTTLASYTEQIRS